MRKNKYIDILRVSYKKEGEKLKILKLSDEVFQYYRENVKGNENISRDQASRKITRNVLLAMEVPPRSFLEAWSGNVKYIYGNLHVIVKKGKVIKMYNHYGGVKEYGGWFFDKKKYIELTKELQID